MHKAVSDMKALRVLCSPCRRAVLRGSDSARTFEVVERRGREGDGGESVSEKTSEGGGG